MNKKILTTICLAPLYLYSTSYAVELEIVNDISKYEENRMLKIENALSIESPKRKIHFVVNPGDEKEITKGNVRSFTLTRVFPRHKIKYDVLCPKKTKGQHKINLHKIHDDQLPGGCQLVRTGHKAKKGGMQWEVVNKKGWAELEQERKGLKMNSSR